MTDLKGELASLKIDRTGPRASPWRWPLFLLLPGVLWSRGIRHSVDDWGPEGGHDWPFWKRQLNEYIGRLY